MELSPVRSGENEIPGSTNHITQSIIKGAFERLHSIEEQILRLEAERDELKKIIYHHKALLSPIQRIPRDVLAEIFIKCLPDDHFPSCNMNDIPLLLTVVCRSWRDLAFSTPRLWNKIHIYLPSTFYESLFPVLSGVVNERREGVRKWLDRSGSLPISFAVCAPLWHTIPPDILEQDTTHLSIRIMRLYEGFMSLLCQYSRRWNEVELRVPSSTLKFIGRQLDNNNMDTPDLLKVLNVTCLTEEPEELRASNLLDIRQLIQTPSLRALYLAFDGTESLSIPIRWENIVELQIWRPLSEGRLHLGTAMQILTRCSNNLRTCVLTIVSLQDPLQLFQDVQLPRLEELYIEFYEKVGDVSRLRDLYGAIIAPALVTLELSVIPHPEATPVSGTVDPPFRPLLERSRCNVLHLGLQIPYTGDVLTHWLRQLPSLSFLKVSEERQANVGCHTITSPLMHAFTDISDMLCPNIAEIHFESVHPSTAKDMLAFAQFRQRSHTAHVRPLKSFKVDFWKPIPEATDLSQLHVLRETGMVVRWRSPECREDVERKKMKAVPRDFGPTIVPHLFEDEDTELWTGEELRVLY
ncbi:hypothetical protein Moror_5267 [Moniliophthora roreri MCA 2997]|nr:hypothetical protein Moror_5267 [Moniliophthora roreri MCA 2997]KAI3610092.1 hypothetical protein WG66_007293 [Moniliophthora roreri]